MDKKIIIISSISAIIIIGAFALYQYYLVNKANVQNINGGVSTQALQSQEGNPSVEPSKTNDVQIQVDGVTAQGASGGGLLTICSDQCGNGACEKEDITCGGLNCVCPEDPQMCPQDCK